MLDERPVPVWPGRVEIELSEDDVAWLSEWSFELGDIDIDCALNYLNESGFELWDFHRPERYPAWLRAQAWLFYLLYRFERVPATVGLYLAREHRVDDSPLRQARKRLGILSEKQAGMRHGGWWWRLPANLQSADDLVELDRRWRRYRRSSRETWR